MNILIFDTETTNLTKPFCYNIGYIIYNTESQETIIKREYIVQQIWHNPMLFPTSYYLTDCYNDKGELIRESKRNIYITQMRMRNIIMEKYGYICRQIARDVKAYEIQGAYAFNSGFDDRVIKYNCEWFKCLNPFDNVPIFDIMTYAHNFICNTPEYINFCEKNKDIKNNTDLDKSYKFLTDIKNYRTNAETVTAFLLNNPYFSERHTALADSEIELEILKECIKREAKLQTKYPLKYPIVGNKKIIIKLNRVTILEQEYTSKITKENIIYLTKKEE